MDGVLYCALGQRHLVEAMASALSSLRFHAVAHLVVTDQPTERLPRIPGLRYAAMPEAELPHAAVAQGLPIPGHVAAKSPGWLAKTQVIATSPFARTLFLDTDTHVLEPMLDVLDLLDRYDVVGAHAPAYRGLDDPDVPPPFYEINTGVLAWRQSAATRACFVDWADTYARWLTDPPFADADRNDQPAFRHCAWRHGLRLYVLGPEYNCCAAGAVYASGPVRLLHARHVDPAAIAARVNAEPHARVFERGSLAPAPPLRARATGRIDVSPRGAGRASDGVLYCAVGQHHLAEAIASAISSLRFHPVEHRIVTDQPTPRLPPIAGLHFAPLVPTSEPEAPDIAGYLPVETPGWLAKTRVIANSPFERTLFLDTDTHVVDPILGMLDLLDHYDVLAAHAPGRRGGDDPEVPRAFYELNTGVLAWRDSPVMRACLTDWAETYARWCEDPPFPGASDSDQPALRNRLWRHRLGLYVLGPEYNCRATKAVFATGRVRLIHARGVNYAEVAAQINLETTPRVFQRRTWSTAAPMGVSPA